MFLIDKDNTDTPINDECTSATERTQTFKFRGSMMIKIKKNIEDIIDELIDKVDINGAPSEAIRKI